MVTPGSTPPCSSFTDPEILPLWTCANATLAVARQATSASIHTRAFIPLLLGVTGAGCNQPRGAFSRTENNTDVPLRRLFIPEPHERTLCDSAQSARCVPGTKMSELQIY